MEKPATFRQKNPSTVNAMKFNGTLVSALAIMRWVKKRGDTAAAAGIDERYRLAFETTEGTETMAKRFTIAGPVIGIEPGDWVVELSPNNFNVAVGSSFEETHEPV